MFTKEQFHERMLELARVMITEQSKFQNENPTDLLSEQYLRIMTTELSAEDNARIDKYNDYFNFIPEAETFLAAEDLLDEVLSRQDRPLKFYSLKTRVQLNDDEAKLMDDFFAVSKSEDGHVTVIMFTAGCDPVALNTKEFVYVIKQVSSIANVSLEDFKFKLVDIEKGMKESSLIDYPDVYNLFDAIAAADLEKTIELASVIPLDASGNKIIFTSVEYGFHTHIESRFEYGSALEAAVDKFSLEDFQKLMSSTSMLTGKETSVLLEIAVHLTELGAAEKAFYAFEIGYKNSIKLSSDEKKLLSSVIESLKTISVEKDGNDEVVSFSLDKVTPEVAVWFEESIAKVAQERENDNFEAVDLRDIDNSHISYELVNEHLVILLVD